MQIQPNSIYISYDFVTQHEMSDGIDVIDLLFSFQFLSTFIHWYSSVKSAMVAT